MSILLLIIVVLVVAGLLIYAVRRSPLADPFNWIAQALIAVVAALVVAQRAGLI